MVSYTTKESTQIDSASQKDPEENIRLQEVGGHQEDG
jgi:hypothetical protein